MALGVFGIWHNVFGICHNVLSIWLSVYLVFGTLYLVFSTTYIWYLHLIHGLDAAQGDVLLAQQLVGSLLVVGGGVQLEGEAEGGDKEAAGVARGHSTHPGF